MAVDAVHCNLSQNGIDHQVCTEDVTSNLEEEPIDHGPGLDDDSPGFQDQSPGFQCRAPPQRSVSESELSRPGTVKLSKPVALWTQQDVCKWLKKHCPNQHQVYSDSFKQHDITGVISGEGARAVCNLPRGEAGPLIEPGHACQTQSNAGLSFTGIQLPWAFVEWDS
uniref:Sterile alpha motif domain containing 12 n=1 Tax=Astyanax mexicanus TaxID=7994 RepID=A0A3B1JH54_ASTMX